MNCFICRKAICQIILLLVAGQASFIAFAAEQENSSTTADPGESASQSKRQFSPYLDEKWIGQGVSYGPYREGQSPQGALPSLEELTEDLEIIAKRWNLIRIYGTSEVAEDVLEIIKKKKLPLRVMLGAWITNEVKQENGQETPIPAAVEANRRETQGAIRLANAYPEIVVAVNVGNETQVFWSAHITKLQVLKDYIRQVRNAINVPVTTADDFNFWNKPESKEIAKEVDFIVTHTHPLWAGALLKDAMPWTQEKYQEVCEKHPDMLVVIGEAGWATQVHDEGEQAKLIKGTAGQAEQKQYYEQFTDWASREKICTFFFEAFDEPWKGGPHPDEVEKHWGLYFVDRTPKAALADSPPSQSRQDSDSGSKN